VAAKVVVANQKLYVNREEGFFGTGLKKDEYVCDCSDIDDIIVFLRSGKYYVQKVQEKAFAGKDIIHIAVFKKNDQRTIYNVVYRDGRNGDIMMKRCAITGVTRDKEYDITKGTEGSQVLYMSANPNGEAELLKVFLKPRPRLRNLILELDFSQLAIKGRSSMGNIFTRYAIHKIQIKEKGVSTLGGHRIWFDEEVLRLNSEGKGKYLGEFLEGEKILIATRDGVYFLAGLDLSLRFDSAPVVIEKFTPDKVFSVVYFDGEQKFFYLKRFAFEAIEKPQSFIAEEEGSYFVAISDDDFPCLEVRFGGKHSKRDPEQIDVYEFIGVKGYKAKGKRITTLDTKSLKFVEPLQKELSPATEDPGAMQDLPPDTDNDNPATQMTLGI
jgi:topoisomerase-4 subunit A